MNDDLFINKNLDLFRYFYVAKTSSAIVSKFKEETSAHLQPTLRKII